MEDPRKQFLQKLTDKEMETVFQTAQKLYGNKKSNSVNEVKAIEKVNSLIGLSEVKLMINKIISFNAVKQIAIAKGNTLEITNHMCFCGAPGTAKTTVARLVAELFFENGITSKNNFLEVGRAELVSCYSGQTSHKVKACFKKASGGVLFIDEAYSLMDSYQSGYGEEAITTLVEMMENTRNDTVVILAGYPDKMQEFLKTNPGLSSRIPFIMNFSDYTADELYMISEHIANTSGFSLKPGVKEVLMELFISASKKEAFGNGRYARNIIERAEINHSYRLREKILSDLTDEELFVLEPEDFSELETVKQNPEKKIGFF